MTIIFFSRRFYPLIGGVEKHVLEIGKRLVKKGHRVIVLTEYEKNTNKQNYQSTSSSDTIEGIEILRIDAGKEGTLKKFRLWLALFKEASVIAKADVVHCHDVFFWYLPFRFLFPFKKVYTTFHGYEGNDLPTKKAIVMHKLAEKLSLGNICIGNFYKKWYGTKPTFVTYGAVDKLLIEQGRKQVNPSKDIIFAGRLEEETGIITYLQALNILKKKNINLKLDIFGDGALKNKAQKYIHDNRLYANIKGFVENVTDYMDDYRFVFVSRYLGILEAMALKKPIFAQYNNSIMKDYLETTPFADFISISKDAEKISKDIKSYLEYEKIANVEKAYSWVKDQTWENMVNLYLKLWTLKAQ